MGAYDRKTRPMDMDTWRDVFGNDDARLVRQTTIAPWRVSTIWLGIDRSYGGSDGPPLIFETVVFEDVGGVVSLDGFRLEWLWSYERQARLGHRDVATFVRAVLYGRRGLLQDTTANETEDTHG